MLLIHLVAEVQLAVAVALGRKITSPTPAVVAIVDRQGVLVSGANELDVGQQCAWVAGVLFARMGLDGRGPVCR